MGLHGKVNEDNMLSMSNFVVIGWTEVRFNGFQNSSYLPSWICCMCEQSILQSLLLHKNGRNQCSNFDNVVLNIQWAWLQNGIYTSFVGF